MKWWRWRTPGLWFGSEIEPILKNRVIGIYNAEFDLRLIRQSNAAHNIHTTISTRRLFA
jgi:hypothetical protein